MSQSRRRSRIGSKQAMPGKEKRESDTKRVKTRKIEEERSEEKKKKVGMS